MRHFRVVTLVSLMLLVLAFDVAASQLVIYSGRSERFVLPLIQEFESETGIQVQLLSGDAAQYIHRLTAEQARPRADLFLANDGAILEVARTQGLFQAITSESTEIIPNSFRAVDDSWIGLAARTRVFMYNTDLMGEADVPQRIMDLADPRYHGQFAITRAGNSSMVTHISALRAMYGDQQVREFLQGVLANEPLILRGHTDIRRAVGAGEVAFGLVNNYYYHLQLDEPVDNQVAAVYPDQGPDEMGAFVNVSGVGLVKGAPNQANALAFIDFLLRTDNLETYSLESRETPLVAGIPAFEHARTIDQYKTADLNLSELGDVYLDTLDLMEAVGFAE